MYSLNPSDEFIRELQILYSKFPGISNKLTALSENPILIAVPTNIPVFCEFYVNAGNRHAILFDIDKQNQIVELNSIVQRTKLYKLINKNPQSSD